MNSMMIEAAIPAEIVNGLRSRMIGQVIGPEDPSYEDARLAWNLSVVQYPAVIAVVESTADVQEAVRFANQNNLGVAVQSTGHGNIRPADDCLLILTHKLDGVEVDPAARTARVEAGVQWGAVLAAAQEYGLAPLLGSSPGVGAIGYTLGGGFGWLGRKYGLSTDNVIQFELVTADGLHRTASADENSDLFWGLRGGGGSLGVITSMTIRLHPVSRVYAGNLIYPAEMAPDVFRHYRGWIADAPNELTSSVLVMNFPPFEEIPAPLRGQSFTMVRGCYCGPIEEGENMLRYWREWRPPVMDDFKEIPFSDAALISNDPLDPMPGYASGAWLSELSDEAIDTITTYALGNPQLLVFTEVRHAGGVIKEVDEESAVYGNRSAELLLSLIGATPTAEAYQRLTAYTGKMKEALKPALTGGVYMNFIEGVESQQRIRDGLVPGGYERLARLKAAVDPDNLFRYAFNISPAG